MYAWLPVYNSNDTTRNLNWWSFQCLDGAASKPPGGTRVTALLQAECRNEPEAERARLQNALVNMLPWLPTTEEDLDSCLHLALLHHRLPAPQRAAREQRIAQHIAQHFGPHEGWSPSVSERLTGAQRLAVLTPDPLLDDHVRSVGVAVAITDFHRQVTSGLVPEQLDVQYRLLTFIAVNCGGAQMREAQRDLLGLYFLTVPAQRDALVQRILALFSNTCGNGLLAVLKTVAKAEFCGTNATRLDTLNRLLNDLAASGANPAFTEDEVVGMAEHMLYQMRAGQRAREARMLDDTVNALSQGKNLGGYGLCTLQALADLADDVLAQSIVRFPTWFRDVARQAPSNPPSATPLTLTVESIPDTESGDSAARTWSTKQVIDWFEGPIASPQKATATNRGHARTKLQARNRKARRMARPAVRGSARTNQEEAWTDDDIGLVVQNALNQSATFFLDEINDLVALGTSQNAQAAAIKGCSDLVPVLTLFLTHPSINEVAARETFAQAELAIHALRQQIRVVEGEARLREQFDRCLAVALTRETMVQGKKHGGSIACPLSMEDWTWVDQRYHRHWLAGATHVATEDGVITRLQPHEALALHVTAKSLSGYAFDISVHLWYRRPGRTSPPSDSLEPFPPMNEDDWYDTYIPCTVLHIPRK